MLDLGNTRVLLKQKVEQLWLELPEKLKSEYEAKLKFINSIDSKANEVIQWVINECIPTIISNLRSFYDGFKIVLYYSDSDGLRCSIPHSDEYLEFHIYDFLVYCRVEEKFKADEQFIVTSVKNQNYLSFELTLKY